MRFAYDFLHFPGMLYFAGGIAFVGIFVALLLYATVRRARDEKRFGDTALMHELVTFHAQGRRAIKSVLMVLGVVCAFVALARPQFGRGTKLIPATNLDVVIVLDYSKSMYARDVTPSRIARAKAEVARLIQDLPGARFGAVAFAGEALTFPITSDGAAIAQFFRGMQPNDMPIGGTATARALDRARDLFLRDPKSKDHVKVMVLVTDGEDLEGDPVRVAKDAGIRIDVVQIGGRAPEVIPEVSPEGKVIGIRRDEQGKPLTTELSAEGEAQLAEIATTTGGTIVRSEGGETGIDRIARGLSKMMREELAERVETVYGDVYAWPLGFAVLFLFLESAIPESPRKKKKHAQEAA